MIVHLTDYGSGIANCRTTFCNLNKGEFNQTTETEMQFLKKKKVSFLWMPLIYLNTIAAYRIIILFPQTVRSLGIKHLLSETQILGRTIIIRLSRPYMYFET